MKNLNLNLDKVQDKAVRELLSDMESDFNKEPFVVGNWSFIEVNAYNVLPTSIGGPGGATGTKSKGTFDFVLNGNYGGRSYNNVDGFWVAPFDVEIKNTTLFIGAIGISGVTQTDIKVKAPGAGSFVSIFSTRPTMQTPAGDNSSVGIGDSGAGVVAPILNGSPLIIAAGSLVRMDLISSMNGSPLTCGMTIYYEEV